MLQVIILLQLRLLPLQKRMHQREHELLRLLRLLPLHNHQHLHLRYVYGILRRCLRSNRFFDLYVQREHEQFVHLLRFVLHMHLRYHLIRNEIPDWSYFYFLEDSIVEE